MNLSTIQIAQILLVVCLVSGIKRHIKGIDGYKTVLVAFVACVLVSLEPYLPPYLGWFRDAVKLLAYSIGGMALLSAQIKKVLGDKVQIPSLDDEPVFPPQEQPTKPELRSLPPAGTPK